MAAVERGAALTQGRTVAQARIQRSEGPSSRLGAKAGVLVSLAPSLLLRPTLCTRLAAYLHSTPLHLSEQAPSPSSKGIRRDLEGWVLPTQPFCLGVRVSFAEPVAEALTTMQARIKVRTTAQPLAVEVEVALSGRVGSVVWVEPEEQVLRQGVLVPLEVVGVVEVV